MYSSIIKRAEGVINTNLILVIIVNINTFRNSDVWTCEGKKEQGWANN